MSFLWSDTCAWLLSVEVSERVLPSNLQDGKPSDEGLQIEVFSLRDVSKAEPRSSLAVDSSSDDF